MSDRCIRPGRTQVPLSRRDWLAAAANGFGLVAASALMQDRAYGGTAPPHYRPKAKNVIFLFMDGGVSHVDSFDPKPKLDELDGKAFNDSKNPTANGARQWLKSPWKF